MMASSARAEPSSSASPAKSANAANSSSGNIQPVLTEAPEGLQRLLLTLVKTFYGPECYVVFAAVQRRVILREEDVRDACRIDLRQLRKFLATLKVDKFIKERLVPEEVDGKVRKFTYYFVNYKGALNVAKYKIDHVRQKLEGREKDDIHRAHYRCTNEQCRRRYEAMDMGKIFDPFSQEMRCWQCKGLVEQDESGAPSQVTRSSMAKFNEQMTGIFSLLKQMDGVRFGREIMEPPIQAHVAKSEAETIDLDGRKLGQRPFSTAGKTRTDLYGGEITVSIGDDHLARAPEAKAEIPWLLTSRQGTEEAGTATALSSSAVTIGQGEEGEQSPSKGQEPEEEEKHSPEEPVPAKRPKREEIESLLAEEEAHGHGDGEEEEGEEESSATEQKAVPEAMEAEENGQDQAELQGEEEEEDQFVLVQGQRVHIDGIDEQRLAQMSEREKADYYERVQGTYADFY